MGQNSLVACTASMQWYKVLVACTSKHDVLGEIVNATLITMMRVILSKELSSSEYPMVQSPCGVHISTCCPW